MGEAYDRTGHFLGSAEAATKSEVLKKLMDAHGDNAHEIRIRTLESRVDNPFGGASVEMPRYKSHKIVHALKIARTVLDRDAAKEDGNRETDGSAMLYPEDEHYAPFKVDAAFVRKHTPRDSFYYVVYSPDGYTSLSPIQAFEEGYTRL